MRTLISRKLQRSGRRKLRRGSAVVEFAFCLPILMVLILGSIEASNAIFLKQSLTSAAYEGIREAARIKSTAASSTSVTNNVLSARQVRGSNIVFTPNDPSTARRGDRISIEVSASISANSPIIGNVVKDRRLVIRSVMVKE